jgi:hypothetical protein
MRKYILFKIAGLVLLVALFAACDTATQEVSPVVSPDGYPKVTFSTDFEGTTVNEGETIIYDITLDKMLDRSVTFHLTQTGGTAAVHDDYEYEPAVIKPYTQEAQLVVTFTDDGIPETEGVTLQAEIGATSLADKYLVHPSTTNPEVDWTIESSNDPTLLTIMFGWDTDDDIDIVTWSNTATYPMQAWGDGGATGDNPEFDKSIWLADPPGTYYVNIMNWGVPTFNYTFTLGYPDGAVEVITGTFDSANPGTLDVWTAWGDPYDSFRTLEVEVTATAITVTEL